MYLLFIRLIAAKDYFCNKPCLSLFPDSLSTSDIVQGLCLQKLTSRKWYVQGTCAVNGEGIYEGMHQLAGMVKEFKHGF